MVENAILCRVHKWGPNSMIMTIDKALRDEMGIVPKDVIAFRIFLFKGKKILVGEKVPLHTLANLKEVPSEVLG